MLYPIFPNTSRRSKDIKDINETEIRGWIKFGTMVNRFEKILSIFSFLSKSEFYDIFIRILRPETKQALNPTIGKYVMHNLDNLSSIKYVFPILLSIFI